MEKELAARNVRFGLVLSALALLMLGASFVWAVLYLQVVR